MTKLTSTNSFWAAVIAEELARSDVGPICLSPGSRNTPLTVALTQRDDLSVESHLDERSAGFYAIGTGRAQRRPAVLVSTSGTATAEYHPAVIESSQAGVPLLVITADRPPELADSGANQTIEQSRLYGDAPTWQKNLPEPEVTDRKLRSLRRTINRAVHETRGHSAGPVHVNVPFRKPLEPADAVDSRLESFREANSLAADGRPGTPYVKFGESRPGGSELPERLRNQLSNARRPLVHVGPVTLHRRSELEGLNRICRAAELPLLADPLSGLRVADEDEGWCPLTEYEFLLPWLPDTSLAEPDLVLRVGQPPNHSDNLTNYFADTAATQVILHSDTGYPDAEFNVSEVHRCSPHTIASTLERINWTHDRNWTREIIKRDGELREKRRDVTIDSDSLFEPAVLDRVLGVLSDGDTLLVGNSSPIRDLVQYGGLLPEGVAPTANRGASGIDGQVSTTAGLGSVSDGRTAAVIGDVSFYHDLTGLLAFTRQSVPATVVVINNDGGGIFHRLGISDFDPPFSEYVRTNHGLTFEDAARQFDATHDRVESLAELDGALRNSLPRPGLDIIEVPTNSEQNQTMRDSVRTRLHSLVSNTDS